VFDYSPGGAFGELALLHGERRHASVRATEACMCWALDRGTFRRIMVATARHTMEERVAFVGRLARLENLSAFERFRIAEVPCCLLPPAVAAVLPPAIAPRCCQSLLSPLLAPAVAAVLLHALLPPPVRQCRPHGPLFRPAVTGGPSTLAPILMF
jgi:hypothetical protein